uniref:alpha-1,2-Mannosidase n=1 Tax=Henneguya salminicola TaxID=69463 RepID=A0A6G3MFX7_HENSL
MEHLACFVGGMYAIASKYVNSELSITYLTRGKELTRTCVDSCLHTTTGLCPDKFNPSDFNSLKSSNVGYYLRPEILESLFYLYRLTGDSQYQELGWKLINSIHEHTRVESGGYSSVLNVNSIPATKNGFQESFFMAETLKYAYLLFSDVNFMSLDKWVYNTEAHPLKIIV